MLAALSTIWGRRVQLAVVTAPYDPMAMDPTSPAKDKSCYRCARNSGRRLVFAAAVQAARSALGEVGTMKENSCFIAIRVGTISSKME